MALVDALPQAVISTGRPRRAYTCDSYNSLTLAGPVTPHIIVDITTTYERKIEALRTHESQPVAAHFLPMAEILARLHGSRIGARYGEAFTPIPVLGRLPAASHL